METHGFHPSFPRRTAQFAQLVTARQNRREKTSLKCCMATAPPSLVRLPVQNVERSTSTFQRGAAARVDAGAIPDLHQNAVFTKRKVGGLSRKQVPPKGGQGTIGPLRRFFSPFSALSQKREPQAMGFWLTERIHASAASRTPLVERKGAVGDWTRPRHSRDSASASAKNDRPSFPASPSPPTRQPTNSPRPPSQVYIIILRSTLHPAPHGRSGTPAPTGRRQNP